MKVLFLLSTNIWFDHLSGEQEAKALKLGFSLIGIQCDFAGIDAEDFNEYDVYVAFSMHDDIRSIILRIPENKIVILVPQIGRLTDGIIQQLSQTTETIKNCYIVARSDEESKVFSSLLSQTRIIRIDGWFIEPFVWNEEFANVDYDNVLDDSYVASFVGDELDERALSFIKHEDPKYRRIIVSSNRCFDKYFVNNTSQMITLSKPLKYGSSNWFNCLLKARYYFEPNSYLTSALLESLWLGVEVISPNFETINSVLRAPLVLEREGDLSGITKNQKRNCIAKFRVNKVAQRIVSKISIKA